MSLTERERSAILAAGQSPLQTERGQAVALVLGKRGADQDEAKKLLAQGYLATTQPSFHLVPRGNAMTPETSFESAFRVLDSATAGFTNVNEESLRRALMTDPAALAPLRMVIGFSPKELAVAMQLIEPERKATENRLKNLERRPAPSIPRPGRDEFIRWIARTVLAVMERRILSVPDAAKATFHGKLDKRDTAQGWADVAAHAEHGVPYWALLYQRYVGGVWRQVLDAYSEVKGDELLELPIARLLTREGIPFHRAGRGATGATETAQLLGITPGPDFALPGPAAPTVIIESKIGEDGGTVRDKAARISSLARAADNRNIAACAVIDGKGWRERPAAVAEVVIATRGRTYSLQTLPDILEVPEIAALRGTVDPE